MIKKSKTSAEKSAPPTPAATTKASSTKHEEPAEIDNSSNDDVEMSDNGALKLDSDVSLPKSKFQVNIIFYIATIS